MHIYPLVLRLGQYRQWAAGVLMLLVATIIIAEWQWFGPRFESQANTLLKSYDRVMPFTIAAVITAMMTFFIEMYFVKWEDSSLRRILHPDKNAIGDIIMWVLVVSQLDYVIIYVASLGLINKLRIGMINIAGFDLGVVQKIDSVFLQVVIYVLILDFMAYIAHRANHTFNLLWTFHKYHHSATEMNVITSKRAHPLEKQFFNKLVFLVPMAIIGIPLAPIIIFRIIRQTLTYFHHSRLNSTWGWFGTYVVFGPHFHRIHHSKAEEHLNRNFGVMLTWWDHLFGTFHFGTDKEIEFGIEENPYNKKGFVHDMIHPFRELRDYYFKKS